MSNEALVWLGIGLAVLLPLAILASLFLVNVGADRIALLERRFIGRELAPGRVFAMRGEVGSQAAYLAPGLHVIPWPIVRVTSEPQAGPSRHRLGAGRITRQAEMLQSPSRDL